MIRLISVLAEYSSMLELCVSGKLSRAEKDTDQFIWEFNNKIFTILVSLENAVKSKDSLTVHLMARYTYEMLVIFLYVILNEDKRSERVLRFLNFEQHKTNQRQWNYDVTYRQMIDDNPEITERLKGHKSLYRCLSNSAHPSNDSFLLNRKGTEAETKLIVNTAVLSVLNLVEINHTYVDKHLFLDEEKCIILGTYLKKLRLDLSSLRNTV